MNEYLVLFHSSLQNFFNATGYVRLASIRETKGSDIDNNGGNRNEMYPLMDTNVCSHIGFTAMELNRVTIVTLKASVHCINVDDDRNFKHSRA